VLTGKCDAPKQIHTRSRTWVVARCGPCTAQPAASAAGVVPGQNKQHAWAWAWLGLAWPWWLRHHVNPAGPHWGWPLIHKTRPAGLEPAIFGLEARRLVHQAKGAVEGSSSHQPCPACPPKQGGVTQGLQIRARASGKCWQTGLVQFGTNTLRLLWDTALCCYGSLPGPFLLSAPWASNCQLRQTKLK
jgi:hypothetical protein